MLLFVLASVSACSGQASPERPEAGTQACTTARPPANAVRAASLVLEGPDFGDATPTDWLHIGFNLDGACTTAASLNTCALAAGASSLVQVDGTGGIDNSFGANICPMLDLLWSGSCSARLMGAIVVTDDSGAGSLAVQTNARNPALWLRIPLADAYVVTGSDGAGMLGATVRADALVDALRPLWGSVSPSLCDAHSLEAIDTAIVQSADILPSGALAPGETCDSISMGLAFTGSTPYSGALPPASNPCARDAGTD